MANSFGELLGLKDNPIQKIEKEISNMEEKKSLLVSAVEQDIFELKHKVDMALMQIGARVYACHMNNTDIGEGLNEHFAEMTSLHNMVAGKEDKIKEIINRYDEEIGMLKKHLPKSDLISYVPQQATNYLPAPDNVTMVFCENCGTPYVQGEDFFCMSCGQKLS